MTSVWLDSAFRPSLADSGLALLVRGYGVLLLITLGLILPHWRRFLLSARWGGYTDSSPWCDRLLRPGIVVPVVAVWFAAAIGLMFERGVLVAATLNLVLCRFFFVGLRWRSATRGFGAPGFMTYWTGAAVCVLLWTRAAAPSWFWLALLVFQVDFAWIMLSSGLYKVRAGYFHNDGMQFGMANPLWGYWWQRYHRWPVDHPVFRILNHLAWSTEIAAAVLMLIPFTRQIGALLIVVSFLFIATQIRLGTLCWMVMLGGLLFFHPGSAGDRVAGSLVAPLSPPATLASVLTTPAAIVIPAALVLYLTLLPLAHLGLWVNFYARRRLPGGLQRALEMWTNLFGIIIWRVFSVDHTNFYVRVFIKGEGATRDVQLTTWAWPPWGRFNNVVESITLTSLFTTLRYFADPGDRFRDRLVRVAQTMPRPAGARVLFRVVAIDRGAASFVDQDLVEFLVDPATGSVEERVLAAGRSLRQRSTHSPIHEAARPGTYAPARG